MRGQLAFGTEVILVSIVLITVFACLVVFVIAGNMIGGVFKNTTLFTNPAYIIPGNHPNALNAYTSIESNYYAFDLYLPFIFFIANIIIIILAGWLNSNPLGYVIGFILMFFFVFVSMLISNGAHGILENSYLASTANLFPHTLYIIANLGILNFAFLILYLAAIAVRNVFFAPAPQQSAGLYQ